VEKDQPRLAPRHAANPTAWLMRYHRLVRCYERRPAHHEAMLLWATVHLMTRRLARELAGLPPAARWDAPPPLPELTSPDRRGKILELLAAQPWRAWRGVELAAILGITNINSFRVQLSQWAHQGHISKIGPGPLRTGLHFMNWLLRSTARLVETAERALAEVR
jgi:hypothetical protein